MNVLIEIWKKRNIGRKNERGSKEANNGVLL
jgi:hypothetical protein